MIQPKIQEVYIEFTDSLFNDEYNGLTLCNSDGEHIQDLVEMNCYLFTPEEFETFKSEFGKELLEKAAENVSLISYEEKWVDDELVLNDGTENCRYSNPYLARGEVVAINKESITSVLDEYLLNNKI